MRSYLERRPELGISVAYVWLPMWPRLAERRALPKAVEEFAAARGRQYWDGAKAVGREVKERILPGFEGEVAWDVWVLFDGEATWESAGDHVIDWGSTVVATEEELFARLEALTARAGAPGVERR